MQNMTSVKPKSTHPDTDGIPITPLVSRLRLKHLQLLEALVELESLRAAAKRLGLAQPAAGILLREMEHAFGVTLFRRSPAGVTATASAVLVAQRTAVAIEALETALEDLSDTAHPLLRVGIVTLAFASDGPQWLSAIRLREPTLRIEVNVGTASELIARLLQGQLDCTIARVPLAEMADQIHKRCQISLLPPDACHVVARVGHPALRRKAIDPDSLSGYEWVLPGHSSQVRKRFHEACALAGMPIPKPVITVDNMQNCLAIAARTELLTLASEKLLRKDLYGTQLRPLRIALTVHEPPLAFIHLKEARHLPSIRMFRETVVPFRSAVMPATP